MAVDEQTYVNILKDNIFKNYSIPTFLSVHYIKQNQTFEVIDDSTTVNRF